MFAECIGFICGNEAPCMLVSSRLAIALGARFPVLPYSSVAVCARTACFSDFSELVWHLLPNLFFDGFFFVRLFQLYFQDSILVGSVDDVRNDYFREI